MKRGGTQWLARPPRAELIRLARFVTVGVAGVGINLTVLYGLTVFGVNYLLAGAMAIESALLVNFFANRYWTFREVSVTGSGGLVRALVRDHAVRVIGMGVNLSVLWFLTDWFGVFFLISQVIGAGAAALWNYVGNLYVTWRIY